MTCIHHVHASLDLSRMMREFQLKHVTRDDGMEVGDVITLHQCRATSSHHVHASLDLSRMMREFQLKHVTRDDGMEFGDVPASHQCRATSSLHMESKVLIVIFALSGITGQ